MATLADKKREPHRFIKQRWQPSLAFNHLDTKRLLSLTTKQLYNRMRYVGQRISLLRDEIAVQVDGVHLESLLDDHDRLTVYAKRIHNMIRIRRELN
jgi:hypothetical protein